MIVRVVGVSCLLYLELGGTKVRVMGAGDLGNMIRGGEMVERNLRCSCLRRTKADTLTKPNFFFFSCIASTLAFYKYDSRSSYEPHVAFIDCSTIVIIS